MSARGLVSRWGVRVAAVAVVGGLVAGGATAGAATSAGALNVRISELPAGVSARVTVSDGRQMFPVAGTTTLRVRPGRYGIVVRFARGSHGLRYFPTVSSQRVLVRSARTTTVLVDYATIVPASTHTPPAAAIIGLSGRAGGSQTLTVRRVTGNGYRVGDVIVAGASRPAPDGLIVRVARVIKRARRTIVFGVQPATLAQALPRTLIDANVPAAAAAATLELGCGNSATATISASLSVSVHARLETGGRRPHLTAASFQLSPTGKTGVAVTTAADGTCTVTRSTGSDGRAVTVHAGPVPIVLVPRASTRVAIGGGYGSGITASELQTVTGTVRLSYDGRTWRRAGHLVRTVSDQLDDSQPAPAAAQRLVTTIAPTVSILLDGLSGPHLDLSDTPSLAYTPTASLDLAHATQAVDGLEPVARPLTDRISAKDATILTATEPLAHRTLAAVPFGGPGTGAAQVVAGTGGTCALLQSGRLYCWGGNPGNGQAQSSVPVLVPSLTDVRQVAVGGLGDICAVLSRGQVDCWGDDSDGEIGNGTEQPTPIETPTAVRGIAAPSRSRSAAITRARSSLTGASRAGARAPTASSATVSSAPAHRYRSWSPGFTPRGRSAPAAPTPAPCSQIRASPAGAISPKWTASDSLMTPRFRCPSTVSCRRPRSPRALHTLARCSRSGSWCAGARTTPESSAMGTPNPLRSPRRWDCRPR